MASRISTFPSPSKSPQAAAVRLYAASFGKQTGKPLVIAATQRSVADQFASEGLSVFPTETEAVTALHQFLAHRELMARTLARKATRAGAPLPPISSAAATTMLNEADSLALLAARGISVVAHRLCRSHAEAVAAFDAIGGGTIAVTVSGRYPLRDAAQAHRDLEGRNTTGSTILVP